MALDRIILAHFRNHAASALENTGHFNLLVGENGAGKTNVLEALSLFAPGRGLRRAAIADMAGPAGDGGFAVGATLNSSGEPVRLGTLAQPERPGRRMVRINGADTSAVSLGEWLSIGWLTPAMDRLFTDSAGARRRFLDRLALALEPGHARHASRYEGALRERNRLLSAPASPDAAWLDALEGHLANYGAMVCAGRARTVAALSGALANVPEEPFARPALALDQGGPASAADLRDALREGRTRDRAAGRTLTGPHRGELEVTMASKQMAAAACSTGEQKAMLIAIVLAHAGLAATDRPRLLLLDEVAAHLDPLRREALFARLRDSGAQVWLTGTELAPFEPLRGEAAVWRVSAGTVERL